MPGMVIVNCLINDVANDWIQVLVNFHLHNLYQNNWDSPTPKQLED